MVTNVVGSEVSGKGSRRQRGERVVLDAVVRVLVRDGLDVLSVRQVAAEAGVSIGAVQHHFRTKDALLVAAADHITAQFRAEAERRTREALRDEGPAAAFLTLCLLLANATDDDATPSVVWLWFAAKASQGGPVADAFASGWSQTEEYLRGLVADVFPDPDPDPDADLDRGLEAAHLLAVLDGLAVARAAEPVRMPAARAAAIVRRHVARMSGHSP